MRDAQQMVTSRQDALARQRLRERAMRSLDVLSESIARKSESGRRLDFIDSDFRRDYLDDMIRIAELDDSIKKTATI